MSFGAKLTLSYRGNGLLVMVAKLEENHTHWGWRGTPVEEQRGEREKGPTLWLGLSGLGALMGGSTLFLPESVTSEALDPQTLGRHLEHCFLVSRI